MIGSKMYDINDSIEHFDLTGNAEGVNTPHGSTPTD